MSDEVTFGKTLKSTKGDSYEAKWNPKDGMVYVRKKGSFFGGSWSCVNRWSKAKDATQAWHKAEAHVAGIK